MLKRLFPIPFGLWLIVTASWIFGAQGVTFRVPAAQKDATLDFNRKYDHTAVELAPDIALLDDDRLTRTTRAWVPFCWICGMNKTTAPIMDAVTHQRGPWIYRAPRPDPDFSRWTNQEGIKASRTIAFNLETGERALTADEFATRQLVLDDAHRLDRSKFARASILAEGCTVIQIAFLIFLTVWSAIFGVLALARKRRDGGKVAA